jgi:hypothetical protein
MLRLYMDQHVSRSITEGLRLREIDVLTAYEDGCQRLPDSELLDRASALGCVLFTQDDDLLVEAHHRQKQDIPFGGVIYGHQLNTTIGGCVEDLELIAKTCSASDMVNQVVYLPL